MQASPSSREFTPQPPLPQAKATPLCTVLARMDIAHHATTLYNYDHSYSWLASELANERGWEPTVLISIAPWPPVQRHVPPSVAIRRRAPHGDRADGRITRLPLPDKGRFSERGHPLPQPTRQPGSQAASPRVEKPAAPLTERACACPRACSPLRYAPHAAAATYRSQLLSCGSSLCRGCHPQRGLGSSRRSRSCERTGQPSALLLTRPLSFTNAAKHRRGCAGWAPRGGCGCGRGGRHPVAARSVGSSRRPLPSCAHKCPALSL